MSFDVVLGVLIMGGVVVLIVVAAVRMGLIGRTDYKISTGIGTWLADINELLQPQQPRVEDLASAREGVTRTRTRTSGTGVSPISRSSRTGRRSACG